MKKGLRLLITAGLIITNLIAGGAVAQEVTDTKNTIGEGVTINYAVTSDEAALEITGCPSRGDKRTPYVYGKLTKGDPFAYEIMTMIIVNNNVYGPKPFSDTPTSMVLADGTFAAQYSSNDGVGVDWTAEHIMIFLIPSGYKAHIKPDVSNGYIVEPAQVSALKENSVCVVQIDREIAGY